MATKVPEEYSPGQSHWSFFNGIKNASRSCLRDDVKKKKRRLPHLHSFLIGNRSLFKLRLGTELSQGPVNFTFKVSGKIKTGERLKLLKFECESRLLASSFLDEEKG